MTHPVLSFTYMVFGSSYMMHVFCLFCLKIILRGRCCALPYLAMSPCQTYTPLLARRYYANGSESIHNFLDNGTLSLYKNNLDFTAVQPYVFSLPHFATTQTLFYYINCHSQSASTDVLSFYIFYVFVDTGDLRLSIHLTSLPLTYQQAI